MNELAIDLDIDPWLFKNRELLFAELTKPPENKQDPVTLADLDTVPSKYYTEWVQDNKKWGADVRSLVQLFRSERFTLPWAIDYATGHFGDPETYAERFDMRRVACLTRTVDAYKDAVPASKEVIESSVTNQIVFDIDRLTGEQLYITPVIVNLLNSDFETVYEKIAMKLLDTCMMLRVGGDPETFNLFHSFCYEQYIVSGFQIKDVCANVQFLICILKLVTSMCPEANMLQIVQYVFIDM